LPPTAPTGPPRNIQVSEISDSHASLIWAPPAESRLNGQLRNYRIIVLDSNNQISHFTAVLERVTLSSLMPYHQYNVSISAVTVDAGPIALIQFQTNESGKKLIDMRCSGTILSL